MKWTDTKMYVLTHMQVTSVVLVIRLRCNGRPRLESIRSSSHARYYKSFLVIIKTLRCTDQHMTSLLILWLSYYSYSKPISFIHSVKAHVLAGDFYPDYDTKWCEHGSLKGKEITILILYASHFVKTYIYVRKCIHFKI